MADLTPPRIEPLGDSTENHQGDSNRRQPAKQKVTDKAVPPPPPIDVDKDEQHQLDEQA